MDFLKILGLVRHGKALSVLKPTLNVLFVAGITFAIIRRCYPGVELPDTFSLKRILEYFLQGEFIVPLGIFFLTWAATKFFGWMFEIINFKITERIRKAFEQIKFITPDGPNEDVEMTPYTLVGIPKKNWTVRMYEAIRKRITDAKIDEIDLRLKFAQVEYTSDFVLIARSLIATIIYFNVVPYFGWMLFSLLIVLHIVLTVLIFIGFQLAALLPIVGSKYSEEYREYRKRRDAMEQIVKK